MHKSTCPSWNSSETKPVALRTRPRKGWNENWVYVSPGKWLSCAPHPHLIASLWLFELPQLPHPTAPYTHTKTSWPLYPDSTLELALYCLKLHSHCLSCIHWTTIHLTLNKFQALSLVLETKQSIMPISLPGSEAGLERDTKSGQCIIYAAAQMYLYNIMLSEGRHSQKVA